jgi:isoleucyl-tRNA synthetase
MDYSQTVNLPKTDFPMKADLPKREPAMLELWEKEKVYEQGVKRREPQKGKKQFILHDGPPYANGHLHLGHALNKILKDIIVRSKTMAGHYAPYVPGWDCHGLPIELALMKELKIDKSQIDRAKFREQAAAYAAKFVEIQKQEFKRLGILGDWDHPYLTMNEAYKKTIVDTFLELQKQGYVYRGKKPVHWCYTDETALAEAELEYESDKGPSIFVAFPSAVHDFSYVIWTTTPWTLPANRAIAYKPGELYGLYSNKADQKRYVIAEKLVENFKKLSGMDLERVSPWVDWLGMKARHPWQERTVPLLAADFVTMDTGTGLVHIAPGHGREDYALGSQYKLEVQSPVDSRGRLEEPDMPWNGVHVFKANKMIMDFLQEKGALLYRGELEHSYPHCWRCHEPVIFRATEQWFLSIDHKDLRQRALAEIEKIDKNKGWIPAYGKNRIAGMLESRPDWCLSRQRFWGTEIPDPVKPKDPDIFDVWFESGVSWAAVLKQRPELAYPADMYLEGSDQHRGWFQVSLIPSVALENQAPFKSVLTHGFVMDGEGRPMSKSLGNVIAPEQIIKQYGADVLRLWVAASDYGGDVRLSQDILKSQADAYRKVRNTMRYLLNNLSDFDVSKDAVAYAQLPEVDRWALHRLHEEVRDASAAYGDYKFHQVTSHLVNFCVSDLSGFYLDAIKDRLYCDTPASAGRRAAQTVLQEIASCLVRLLAPILSFTMDECWRFMGNRDSVALTDLPASDSGRMDAALKDRWKILLSLRELTLGEIEKARAAGRLKAPREAKALLRTNDASQEAFFKGYAEFLPMILGVSQTELTLDLSVTGIAVEIQKIEGAKCTRCWIYKTDIGQDAHAPDLCQRCAAAVAVWSKAHPELAAGAQA